MQRSGLTGSPHSCMIVSAEVPHLRLRDKVLTVSYISSFALEFGVSFSLPYLLYAPYANLESKVGFIYGTIAFLGIVWAYFCLPETTGRSLEEIEELWQEGGTATRIRLVPGQERRGQAGLQAGETRRNRRQRQLRGGSQSHQERRSRWWRYRLPRDYCAQKIGACMCSMW